MRVCKCVCASVCTFVCVCMYVSDCAYIYVYMCLCMYVCVFFMLKNINRVIYFVHHYCSDIVWYSQDCQKFSRILPLCPDVALSVYH